MSDLTAAVAEVSAAAPSYEQGTKFYRGEIDEVFASAVIERMIGSTAKHYKINLARRVVDAVLDRMKIASISVPGNDKATARLIEIWDRNRLGAVVRTLHRGGLSQGDGYMFVWPSPDDENEPDIFYRSPERCRIFYDDENPNRKKYASFVWAIADGEDRRLRVNLLYRDRIERYISKPGTKGDQDEDFESFLDSDQDEDDWLIENPYGEIPVFHFRTDEPYGRPEHADAFGPQNAINKLVAVHMSSVDYQGFPQRYRLRNILKSSQGVDTPYLLEEDEDSEEDYGDEDGGGLTSGPGTVWDLSDTSSVGAFPAAESKNFLDPLNFYARAMGAATGTPLRFMDPSGDVPSGESLRADDAPLTERIGDRQTWFGDEHKAMLRFALRIAGVEVGSVALSWRPVQIINDAEGWATVKAKIDAGVPQEVALAEAGYRPEEVAAWMDGSETTNLATRVELIGKIAQAMQGLGTAVTLGVISQEQVESIVAELLGDSPGREDEAS